METPKLSRAIQSSSLDTRWGLHVYRATYQDQELWDRYMEYIRNAVMSSLQPSNDIVTGSEILRYQRLRDSFQLVARENKDWDDWTVWKMRERSPPTSQWYFIYVNKDTLADFKAIDDARQTKPPNYFEEEVTFTVVHTLPGWRDDDDDDDDDAGKEWQYVCAYWLARFFELTYGNGGSWFDFFVRPPRKWNGF
ncbi:hypothetical protein NPX13_g406 [Xylaria arbuscula]|uniref:Uncharacterized protein n=1 Tax=Xylaria arbuscula TaxID=114810 RepID=A0A9W8NNX2_9PEZI|nr:hypothetical protein NPX13_g406 [Xylaria arbuscula]